MLVCQHWQYYAGEAAIPKKIPERDRTNASRTVEEERGRQSHEARV